jgi:DNA polymerase-3 subunit epsilon
MSRQIVLDTETTGLNVSEGHRIIEIGAVEIIDRRPSGNHYHQYFKPDRNIEAGALEVHGISEDFLADKPRFEEVAAQFMDFIRDAELVIHNAPFDVGFLNYEFSRIDPRVSTATLCTVLDTLALARELHPGQRNSLDALCSRYSVDNSARQLHGALLDAQILADVYLMMTGGQVSMDLASSGGTSRNAQHGSAHLRGPQLALPVVRATVEERRAHELRLDAIDKASDGKCLWRRVVKSADDGDQEPGQKPKHQASH